MTPSKAIRLECKWCMGGRKTYRCDRDICKLNNKTLSPLKRIKAHCLDCVETRQKIKDCTGKLLFEDRLCYLHIFKFGRNPKLKGIGNSKNFKKPSANDMVSASKNPPEMVHSGLGR